MNIKTITSDEVNALLSREEDHFFDYKAINIKSSQIQKISVALANADGGEFLVGISERKDGEKRIREWKGGATIEDFNQHIQSLTEIKPRLPFRYSFIASQGQPGYVLHVEIEKSDKVHETPGGDVYVRMSAQSLPIKSRDEILSLTYAKGATSFEDNIVKGVPIEVIVDSHPVRTFLNDYSPKTDPLEFVVNHGLSDVLSWEPRVAGVLLFASNPSASMPRQCAIKIARYETREDEPEREHLKETFTIEGNLYEQIHAAANKIKEIMSGISIWTIEGKLSPADYPPEAIWEILVNAVIHRDYSVSDNIQVLIYNNRIEILSPGKFPGHITPDNVLASRYSRNPRLVRTLNRYKDPPNKDMGEGLNTAFQKMKEWKLRSPIIDEVGNCVKVTIPHTPLATPEEAVLEFLSKNPRIKNSQARDLTGIKSENAIKNVFIKLKDKGLIERVPGLEGAASAWQLCSKKP